MNNLAQYLKMPESNAGLIVFSITHVWITEWVHPIE